MVNIGERVVKLVWDYGKRVNHQKNSKHLKYPHAKRTFNLSAILTRVGLVNTDRSNVSTARFYTVQRLIWGMEAKDDFQDHGAIQRFLLQESCVVDSGCLAYDWQTKLIFRLFLMKVKLFSRAPRKDDVYNLDLKNIVPSGEKQLNHNVKIIRCDNGTEFKNYVMNEFCAKKGIKREFSVARTPQQNGVAERKNRTLIEAARTMLADSLLPIPFWAEAVNTACYVLNRVLVTKPQNKTPYELLIGKFDGKSDEGYLLGYSTSSKAFRVYNKRTKRVEENLHINFLEDQPNVAGTGPNWMFDLDFLTNSMNYIPVSVENQDMDSVKVYSGCTKNNLQKMLLQTGYTRFRDVIDKEEQTIMLPKDEQVWQDELKMMVTQELVANAMNDVTRQAFKEEKRRIASQKKANQATSTNQLSTDRPFCCTDLIFVPHDGESSFVYLGGKIPIDASTLPNADLPIDLNMPDLEYASDTLPMMVIIGAYDDNEDVGAGMFNNMDNTIAVSPIPTLRIHKDHPKGQILGDPTSAVQTRGKIQKASSAQQALVKEPKTISQALKDESWVEAMQEELLQFKLQQVWILVDLPFGKKAIGTKWVFRNKRDERSIVVKNKARLVAQGHRQEEGIDYDEVFAPIARIEAIRLFLAFASYMGFLVYQMDVKSAFLLWPQLKKMCIVNQPPGFVDHAHSTMSIRVEAGVEGDVPEFRSNDWFQVTQKLPLTCCKEIFRYLKSSTQGLGSLWYPRDSPFELEAFSDSDYAGASLDRKSTTGGC
ncbi:putative ribonuclease H-like domain-containing protein [Tanacetum coccineum]